jgi:hypothetical protein
MLLAYTWRIAGRVTGMVMATHIRVHPARLSAVAGW